MELPKNIKDIVYALLQEPTLEKFRDFMRGQTGEHNPIDFKEQWISDGKLAKEILAIANFGGGLIVFGVKENDDCRLESKGLPELKDKADIGNALKRYISPDLKYTIHDFEYNASEYKDLEGKKFQLLIVEDTPEHLPFVSQKAGTDIREAAIYTRRGTACVEASESEIKQMIERRINHEFPNGGHALDLSEHLKQLRTLYANIDKDIIIHAPSIQMSLLSAVQSLMRGPDQSKPNPYYPPESCDEFISKLIQAKKEKIRRMLDLK